MKQVFQFVLLSVVAFLPLATNFQTAAKKVPQSQSTDEKTTKDNEELLAAQRRAFAVSQVISLADEARSYRDIALRPHVLARAADTLWDADRETARALFHRAWDAAETADAEDTNLTPGIPDNPRMAALMRAVRHDLRSEVLRLAAKRDRALGEEFLKKLGEAIKRESADTKSSSSPSGIADNWSGSDASSRRLEVARSLLDEDQIDRALEFAAPALDQVNQKSIDFLSALRAKRPQAADEAFAFLLARADGDPASDANTVSGLSCYAFSPGSYVTFFADGSAAWGQGTATGVPPDLPPGLRSQFFRVAADILLRPLPPPDQDYTSSGRAGKYMVIKRLLPLFVRYAPDLATPLYSQLASLASDVPAKVQNNDTLSTWNLTPQVTPSDALHTMQDKLDHAKSSRERDQIYMDAAITLSSNGDSRAQDIAKEIDDSSLRDQVRSYVDFGLVQSAVKSKKVEEIMRLAKAGELNHLQRVWAYTEAVRLLMKSERPRALSLLDSAADEARRIEASDPDRARALLAVATQFVTPDSIHAWELLSEAVKAANSAEKFTGEDTRITSQLWTKEGPKSISVNAEDFGFRVALHSLSKGELDRSVELAKSFRNEAVRAAAILTIAGTVLEK
jgi:hypothetical protein